MNRKNMALLISLLFCIQYSSGQNKKNYESDQLLSETADKACKCVDSINAKNKPKDILSKEISKCINTQTAAYQLGAKLMSIKELEKDAKEVDGRKQINIYYELNEESDEYKKYYFEIERYMRAHCTPLKTKMSASGDDNEAFKPTNLQAIEYYNQAIEETKKENYKKAILLYNKCVAVDPTFVNAWDNLGLCYRRIKEYDKSIASYNKSLEINPNGLMPLQNLGIVYRYKLDYSNAIKSYEKLALIDKNNPEVYFGLGQVYAMDLKEYEKGLDNICKAYNLYIVQKSPYRTDAELLISQLFKEMKNAGKETTFDEILKKNNISTK